MRIQHNILALNAYRNYNNNTSALGKNLEKLSSGYRINRAGDDAAGLAISEKMRAQITGLSAAQKNVKDGISLVKTAEGAMQEIHDMLNRMDYLATQSANGTYQDPVDRENLQKEVDALRTEINRIADSSNFNGINLLDGSMQEGFSGTTIGEKTDIPILQTVATNPTLEVGTKTVLHEDGTSVAKTSFDVELHNVSVDAAANDKIKVTIGDVNLEFDIIAATGTPANKSQLKAGTYTDEDLANAIKDLFEETVANGGANKKISGQDFDVTVDGNKLSFVQTNDPTKVSEVVDSKLEVKVEFVQDAANQSSVSGTAGNLTLKEATWDPTKNAGNASIAAGSTGGSTDSGAANVTVDASGLNADAILAALNANDPAATAGDVTIEDDGSGTLQLKDGGGNIIGKATTATGTFTGAMTVTFTTDGTAAGTALGTIALNASTAVNNPGINTNSGLATSATTIGAKATLAGSADLKDALDGAGAASGDVKVSYSNGKYYVGVGKQTVEATGTLSGGVLTLSAGGKDLITITDAAGTATEADFQKALEKAVDTGLDYAASKSSATGTWNVGTDKNVQGAAETSGQLASTTFELTADMVKDGASVTIGKDTYTFKIGKDSKVSGNNVIDLTGVAEKDLVSEASRKLSLQENQVFTIGYDESTGKISVHEKEGQTIYTSTSDDGNMLADVKSFDSLIYANKPSTIIEGEALTLQIGDTSDSFNQMKLSIGDMHTKSMGTEGGKSIADIDISNQAGAQEAVQVIKDAINYVSSIRGDLGATQNRLEHTANNLSVMSENIQDAESTIRDTDVAEEMMAYTKNNILVQAAQAMLAQANAVPQGVLQLLQ